MEKMLIGSANPHKQKKLSEIISGLCSPVILKTYPDVPEKGDSFQDIAEQKALAYARQYEMHAIASDGGAIIPALSSDEWEPLRTRRFGKTDKERIERLLELMQDKEDRTVQWVEAIAIANPDNVLFSATARAMDGVLDAEFRPQFYRQGIWLCSITSFPQFGGRNFFELSSEEQAVTENSWEELCKKAQAFLESYLR